jgi:hypothetical protein
LAWGQERNEEIEAPFVLARRTDRRDDTGQEARKDALPL